MNKIFKVIWNHATQSWVAVSEFTKAHGKTKSVKLSAVATAIAAAATVGGTAHAAVSIGTTTGTTIATEAGGTFNAGISIGEGASTEAANDIAIGQGASIDRGDAGSPVGSIVIGNKAESTGQFGDIVIGALSKTGKALGHPGTPSQITVIGSRSFAYGNQASVLSSDAVATGSSSIAMGGDDINDARVALDRDVAEFTAANNKAIKNNYEYIWGLVDPTLTETLKNTKIDMAGYGAVNPELKDTAAANLNDTHFLRTWAAGDASIALGYAAQTLGTGSHAIGVNAVAYSTASNAIGVLARAGDKTNVAGSTNANAFGTAAVAAAKDANAIGHNATVASGAVGAIAFGVNASATAASNVVIGSESSELSSTNTVGGQGNKIDSGVVGGVPYSGFAGEDKLVGVVSVGNGDQTRQIINVAPGAITAESTDAINGSQLYQVLKPITFTANSNKDAAVTDNGANFAANDGAQIPLNQTLNIIGATASKDLSLNSDAAVDGTYSAKNIQTVVTTNNQLQIQMAENPQFKSVQLDDTQIPASADATKADAPAFPNGGKNAISANDLMNTGWNLQANDTAVDLVNPYNTVNFKGEGVTITPETDGNKSTLTFKVEQPTAGTFKADENGSVAPTDGEGDKFASVQGVANAVNNSYWNINTSQDGKAEAKVGDGKVNPSNDVVINGKDAVKVTAGTSTDNKYVIDIAVEADGSTVEIKDGKITAKTAPLAAEPVADLTAPTAGKIAAPAGDAGNALTTAANVAEMINAAAWKATSAKTGSGQNNGSTVELIQAGETVTFEAGNGVTIDQAENKFTFSVKADGTTTEINDKGEIVAKAPETATVTNVAEGQDKAGSVEAPTTADEGKLVTAKTLADAINNSGFTLKASAAEGTEEGSTVEQDLIKAGETVEMIAGKNLNVKQDADGKVTYSTKENVEFTEIKVAAPNNIATNPITIGTNPEGKNVISGLDTRIPEAVTKTDPASKPAGNELKNAATLGDVLNAAWNLQRDGQDVDAVTPYNTVNHTSFKQGETVAQGIEITHDTDGDVSNIRYAVKVDNTTTRINDKGEVEAIQPVAGTFKADENGSLAPTDAAEGNKLASVQGVSDAVNASYWNINTSQDGANKAAVGDGKVNPSNNVVINGTGAVEVKAGTSTANEYVIDVAVKTDDTTVEVKDGKIAAKTSTLAAAPTTDLTAQTAGQILAGDAPTALTTAQNVADMINAAAWKATSAKTGSGQNTGTSVELIQAGETVTFEAGNGVTIDQATNKFTFSVKADGTTTEINDKGEIVAKAPETATVTNVEEGKDKAGSVTAPTTADEGKLVTAKTLADAINNSGFTLKASAAEGTEEGSTVEQDLIKAGETVEMIAGKNLNVKQDADGKVTYSTKENVEFTEIKVAAPNNIATNPITIGTNPEGKNVISGLDTRIPEAVTKTDPATKPAGDELRNAATLGDVLNAAWNLQRDGQDVDAVTPYNTVNHTSFKQGETVAQGIEITHDTDGDVSNIRYAVKVDNTTTRINDKGEVEAIQPTAGTFKADENGSLAPTAGDETKLASVQGVSDAVNNSYWNINTSQDGAGEAKVGDGKVNPSNNVVFNGVGAVKVAAGTTDEGKYTVDFSVETDDTTVEVKDGKIAAKTSTLAAAPTENPAAPTAGTILAGDNPTALTTAKNVADMINAAAWKATSAAAAAGENTGTSVELVQAGDTVTFEADSGVKIVQDAGKFTFSVKTDGTTTEINDKGEIVAKAPETAPLTNADNKVTTPTGADANKLATAGDVANAINNSGFTLKHSVTDGEDKGGAEEVINPGDVVDMVAGKNLSVQQEANGRIIYATKDKVEFTEVKVGGDVANPITIGTNPAGENVISGLSNTLAPLNVNPAETKAPTFDDAKLGSAATLSDVLNAGWNLQNNGTAKDFVKPYDTVNFVDGKGTKAVVEVKADGTIADVKFDVDVAPITNNADGSVTGPANSTELADARKAAEDALAALPADATPEEKVAAEKAVQAAKDAITNAGNQLATAQNVADAINASGWNATSGKVGTGEVEGTTNELINPSETVTFQAGDNMMLKQEGNVFTYSVNPNPVFNNVTANQVTVGGAPATQDAPAKAPIVIGTNPEGVNEITGLDTTLPVPAETATKPADINENKAATLGDVLNAGWNLKNNGEAKDVVTPYDTVDFVDGNGTKVVVESKDGVSTVKVDIDTAELTTPVTANSNGTVNRPAEPNKLATAGDVRNAINNSGWKATSGQAGSGLAFGTTEELINPGETVTFKAGNNMVLLQEGNNFTYSVNNNPEFNSVKVGGNAANNNSPITIGTAPNGDNFIDGLTTTLAQPTTEVSPATKPAADKLDNAATLGDVLNAAWNLKNNGEAKDAVSAFDTVDFINGQGTEVSIESDGTVSKVKVDVKVDGTTVKFDKDGNLTAVQPDTLVNGDKVGGNVNFVDSDTVTATPGDNPGDIKFNVNTGGSEVTADGKAAPKAGDENKVATVGDIVNTINGVGFNAKVAQTGTGVGIDKGGDALVNAGDTVTITAGDNIQVTKEGLNYTVETKKDVTFNSVTANQAIFGGSPATEEAPAKAPIIIGTTPVDPENPAKPVKNVISGLDHTLPTAKGQTKGSVNEGDISPVVNAGLAATVGDVLNAGWNLQENGTAKDLVTAYNTVNFANGKGTAVNITSANDVSEVKVDVKTANSTTINLGTDKDGNIVANANTSPITVNVENGSIAAPANPDALATSGNVADAIKGSGFTLTAQGQNGSVVNPGETVDMKNTDGNISITKDAANNDVVYNLSPTINVTNVNAAGNVNAGSVTTGGLTVKPNSKVDMGGNRVTNVAKGVDRTDAVNVEQLKDEIGAAVAPIHNRINKVNKDLRAGIAGANAAAGLPQVYIPGKSMVAASAGTFKGQSAVAVGYSRASDNGKLILKLQGNANTRGDVGGSIGVGYQW